jgi:hypothetical protein
MDGTNNGGLVEHIATDAIKRVLGQQAFDLIITEARLRAANSTISALEERLSADANAIRD